MYHALSFFLFFLQILKADVDIKVNHFIVYAACRYHQTQKQLENARTQLRNLRRAARKTDVELERVDACLSRLREIMRLKTTTDTLSKIFHGMPATPRHSVPHRSKTNRKGK